MPADFFQRLSVRLAGLILLLSGSMLLILTEINRRAVERILSEQAEVQAAMAIAAVAEGLEANLGAIERTLRLLARELEGRRLNSTDAERLARNAMVDHPNILGFAVAFEPVPNAGTSDRVGVLVQRSNTPSRFVTRNLAAPDQSYWERDWYREVIDKGIAVWSEPFFDQGGADRNVVRISAPFFHSADDERPAGAISATIDLDWLRRLANTHEFADTSHVIVFSRTGRIILHPKPNFISAETMESLAEKSSAPELVTIWQSVIARRQGAMSYRDGLTGRTVRVNYKPARVAGWGAVVAYDEAEFLKGQRAFRNITMASIAATLLILAGIVIGVTHYALRPLGVLANATGEIARGNLDCAIPSPARRDEIGRLMAAFGSMRDALKAQHLERLWAATSIEHQLKYNQLIVDSIDELVFVLTKALNISRINSAVTRIAGYSAHEIVKLPLGRIMRLGMPGATLATDLDQLTRKLKAGHSVDDMPAVITKREGGELEVRLRLAPLFENNRVVGAIIVLRVTTPPIGQGL